MPTIAATDRIRVVPTWAEPHTVTLTLVDSQTGAELAAITSRSGEMRPAALDAAAVALARSYLASLEADVRPHLCLV